MVEVPSTLNYFEFLAVQPASWWAMSYVARFSKKVIHTCSISKGRSKSSEPHPEGVEETREFFIIFFLISSPFTSMHLVQRYSGIEIPLQKKIPFWSSKNSSIACITSLLFPKWQPCRWDLSSINRKKSDGAKSGESRVWCSNSKSPLAASATTI